MSNTLHLMFEQLDNELALAVDLIANASRTEAQIVLVLPSPTVPVTWIASSAPSPTALGSRAASHAIRRRPMPEPNLGRRVQWSMSAREPESVWRTDGVALIGTLRPLPANG